MNRDQKRRSQPKTSLLCDNFEELANLHLQGPNSKDATQRFHSILPPVLVSMAWAAFVSSVMIRHAALDSPGNSQMSAIDIHNESPLDDLQASGKQVNRQRCFTILGLSRFCAA